MALFDFSVSMCVYGGDNPEHFDMAINSIINQTTCPNEIVITVDGPIPDQIEDVLTKYAKNLLNTGISFKVVRIEKNMGHGEARRICFENCSHQIIALMDADDLAKENRFEQEIRAFIEDPSLSVVGSHVSEFSGNPENVTSRRLVKLEDAAIKEDMKVRCPMNQPTVMFKRSDVAEVGGYLDWFCNEDYFLWIRLAKSGKKFKNINDCLVNMRVDDRSYQRRGGWKYFQSEAKIQKLMLDDNMIGIGTYIINLAKRFIVQMCIPNKLRGWAFKQFARN